MRHVYFLVLLAVVSGQAGEQNPASRSAGKPLEFFVATNGNDAWSGVKPQPGRNSTDGPFATVARALQAAREAAHPGSTTIWLRGGLYFLQEPLVLRPADSGLTLAAYRNEKPILSGGCLITGWKQREVDGKKLWTADLPERGGGNWEFRELWVNGTRAQRARHPNRGYLKVAEVPDKAPQWTQGQTRFRFKEGELKAWKAITNSELVVMSRWVESRLPVSGVDEAERTVRFGKRSVFELAAGDPYYLEGAFEFLDQPGEWFLERAARKIYYMPRPGETIERLEAIAPVLTQVMRIEGKPTEMKFVERVSFRGLRFSHTEWYFAPANAPNEATNQVGGFSQAAIGVPGAVWGEGVRQCRFADCTISSLGNYGLELGRGCQNNHIIHCEFADAGAGGIKIGETGFRENPGDQTTGNEIQDCRIHDGGKMFHSAIGIWLGQSPSNRLVHNLIHDFYYTGVSIGWTWGYGPSSASNNLVEFNHVHHIGIKSDGDGPILSDMGGIYTLGKQPGTRIINNCWHDIAGLRYGGWGIYFDEGSSGILAESNVVYRTTHGGFHQHYGETNMVFNNIFAFAREHQLQRSRLELHPSFTFQTNIVYFDAGALLAGNWSDNNFRIDWNVYYDARPGAGPDGLRFEKATFTEWRARDHDQHSIFADPLFVAPQKNDFRLNKNSPALKLGFSPIDLSQVGPRLHPTP